MKQTNKQSGVADKSIKHDRTDEVKGNALEFFLFRSTKIWGWTIGSHFGLVSCLIHVFLRFFAYFSDIHIIVIIWITHWYEYFVNNLQCYFNIFNVFAGFDDAYTFGHVLYYKKRTSKKIYRFIKVIKLSRVWQLSRYIIYGDNLPILISFVRLCRLDTLRSVIAVLRYC